MVVVMWLLLQCGYCEVVYFTTGLCAYIQHTHNTQHTQHTQHTQKHHTCNSATGAAAKAPSRLVNAGESLQSYMVTTVLLLTATQLWGSSCNTASYSCNAPVVLLCDCVVCCVCTVLCVCVCLWYSKQ